MINNRWPYKFCSDDITQIENYTQAINDTTQTWHCHHRFEIELNLSKQELIDRDLYYNRPANELIFLTKSEHISLHNKYMSEERRQKISKAHKGKSLSSETKRKLSEAKKGKPSPIRGIPKSEKTRKKMIEVHKGKHRVYDENGKYHYE